MLPKFVKEPCPKCNRELEITLSEIAERETSLVRFCGWCGAQLHSSCPSCKARLTHLFRFCPQCGFALVETSPPDNLSGAIRPQTPEKGLSITPTPKIEAKCLSELRQDLEIVEIFWRATFDLLIALNPIISRGFLFSEQLKHITAETSAKQDSLSIERAIQQGDLSNIGDSMDRYVVALARSVEDLTTGWYPPIQSELHLHTRLEVPATLIANLTTALRSQQKAQEALKASFITLKRGLPRFQAIASTSSFWQFMINAAISTTLTTSPEDAFSMARDLQEEGKSDEEFLKSFQDGVNSIQAASKAFREQLAQAASSALEAIFSIVHSLCQEILAELAGLSAAGIDLAPTLGRLQLGWQPSEAWARDFVDLVLEEVGKRGLSAKALERLHRFCTNGRPWNIDKWPELDLYQSMAVLGQREDTLRQKISDILGSGASNCYLAPNIPEGKIQAVVTTYACGADPNRIVFLYDHTAFGSAKDGFTLTVDDLFWHNMKGEDAQHKRLANINNLQSHAGLLPHLEVDGEKISLFNDPERLQAVLTAARDQARTALLESTKGTDRIMPS